MPDEVKAAVTERCDEFIESVLKPKYMAVRGRPRNDVRLVEISTKWFSTFFCFQAKYHCKGRKFISPSYEMGFARLEYVGKDRFNLSYMRHTGRWWQVGQRLTLEKCLEEIREGGIYEP